MNPGLVALAGYVLLGLGLGVSEALQLGDTGIAPSLLIPLVVVVAMRASAMESAWTGLLAGLAVDLLTEVPVSHAGGLATIPGPNALGFLAASQAVVAARGVLYQRGAFAVGVLSALAAGMAHLVVVLLMTLRAIYDKPSLWAPWEELFTRAGSSLYTGLAGLVLGFALLPLASLAGAPDPSRTRFGR